MHAVDATDRLSVWAGRTVAGRLAEVDGASGAGSISGVSAPPEGGTDGLGRLHRLRHAAVGAALGRRLARRRSTGWERAAVAGRRAAG